MSKVSITRSLLDDLAMSISAKSGEPVPLTLTEMKDAVDSISGGDITVESLSVANNGTYTAPTGKAYTPVTVSVPTPSPTLQSKTYTVDSAGTATVTADSGYDGLSSVAVSVPSANWGIATETITREDDNYTFERSYPNFRAGYYSEGESVFFSLELENKSVAPSLSQQVITQTDNYCYLDSVTVSAMPSGTAGTPTATKGTVSNHSVSVTPSVTNATGYITGGTKNGTAVTVSASELVSGTYTVDSSGTKDVTNYASTSVPTGTAGTPSASKGAVSNHSVSVTPSVTNATGWITGSTKTGTAVTVSASELVSGTLSLSANGTSDCTNYASVTVAIPFVTYYTGSSAPSSSLGNDGDIYLKTV